MRRPFSSDESTRNDVVDRWKFDFAIITTRPIWRATRQETSERYLSATYKYLSESRKIVQIIKKLILSKAGDDSLMDVDQLDSKQWRFDACLGRINR